MQQPAPFLILDDDDVFAQTLARALTRRGFAHTGGEALALARQARFAYVTVDLHLAASDKGLMPHGGTDSGLHWIAPLRQALPDARMLILTGYASIATAVQAVKLGADEYLAKPANVDSILLALQVGVSEAVAEQTMENPAPLSVARLEWEHIQRQYLRHRAGAEHASTHAAAQAGQAAGRQVNDNGHRQRQRAASLPMRPVFLVSAALGTCSRSVASGPRLARETQPYTGTASIAAPRSGRAAGS
jgi:two-component system response regulator RegA